MTAATTSQRKFEKKKVSNWRNATAGFVWCVVCVADGSLARMTIQYAVNVDICMKIEFEYIIFGLVGWWCDDMARSHGCDVD